MKWPLDEPLPKTTMATTAEIVPTPKTIVKTAKALRGPAELRGRASAKAAAPKPRRRARVGINTVVNAARTPTATPPKSHGATERLDGADMSLGSLLTGAGRQRQRMTKPNHP
jgi:hypothetical protein